MKLFNMAANKLFGILLVMVIGMVHLNMADEKSYSKSSANVQRNIIEDEIPTQRDLDYKTILNVALFPFLPDLDGDYHRNLLRYIQDEYETLYPDVRLLFRRMNATEDFYDTKVLTDFLDGPNTIYDVLEIDTVMLGDLVDAGVVAPQYLSSRYPPADWHPAATSGVTVNGEIYAYPHLLCAILLFTRDVNIASAVTVDDLTRAINVGQPQSKYKLVGNLKSSWDLTALYFDSYREANLPHNNLYGSFDNPSPQSVNNLLKIAQQCASYPTVNDCINGAFDDENNDVPAQLFATRQALAMYGYSERLHYVLKKAEAAGFQNNIGTKIKPLPLGNFANEPLFFTDAFVFRRGMSTDKFIAARNFVEFMATPKMQAAVVAAEETAKKPKPYRYLLPMSSKAYTVPPLSIDYFYQTYFRNLTGQSLPNRGMNKMRNLLKQFIYTLFSSQPY